ncbi:DUF4365 domain-containing protein, partial [Burkholderia ubonensis]
MDITKQKEQFNKAYVRAIAAQAGFNPSELDVDDDSVDLELSGRGFTGVLRNPKVQFQLKCTSQDLVSGDVDLSVILWARHIMRVKSHGYADEEEETNGGLAGSGPRAA